MAGATLASGRDFFTAGRIMTDAAQAGPAGPDSAGFGAAVIIPHYNDVARLTRCLDRLMAQDRAGVEIVVVDNGSTQPMDALRTAHPGVRFVTEPRKGAATARNRGVRETTAPWLFFLDADCLPAPDWLAAARAHARDHAAGRPGADIIGGRVDVFDETPPPRSGAEAFETVFAFHCRDYVERKGFSVTANLLTRRDVFAATGDFVNGLPEDREWCLRATRRGYRLAYDDGLRVAHPTRSDWPALARKWRRLTDEGFALHRAEGRGRAAWALTALATLASGATDLPKVFVHPGLTPGERLRGAGVLLRLRALRAVWMLRQCVGPQSGDGPGGNGPGGA
jgi:cellulose synthase/poly-beta-1,6-N-acetylglucosamine synthase-like glycosyltransferase